jgi:hypothetical protein
VVRTIRLFVRLILSGISLRGASRALQILNERSMAAPPHWTTGRLWLLRLGHAELTRPKQRANDWAWLVDHSVQIGTQKCLQIVGLRLRDLPPPGRSLRLRDLELIALRPKSSWTRADVDEELERASRRTGAPRVIVDDHAPELTGGVGFFRERHPGTVEVYDVKHKAACLLKRRLESDPRWGHFQQEVGRARWGLQQTELACLIPPGPKLKARYMNLGPLVRWAERCLAWTTRDSRELPRWASAERIAEKLGWLKGFEAALGEWAEWQRVVDRAVHFIGCQGIYRGAAGQLRRALPRVLQHASSRALAKELVGFVRCQSQQADPGERLPGSTEILESCFGRFKALEKQHARGGFTSLVLATGALLADTSAKSIRWALERTRTSDVAQWCRDTLGTTLFAQRRQLALLGATKLG